MCLDNGPSKCTYMWGIPQCSELTAVCGWLGIWSGSDACCSLTCAPSFPLNWAQWRGIKSVGWPLGLGCWGGTTHCFCPSWDFYHYSLNETSWGWKVRIADGMQLQNDTYATQHVFSGGGNAIQTVSLSHEADVYTVWHCKNTVMLCEGACLAHTHTNFWLTWYCPGQSQNGPATVDELKLWSILCNWMCSLKRHFFIIVNPYNDCESKTLCPCWDFILFAISWLLQVWPHT